MSDDFRIITGADHPDFLDLPWTTPLASWDHPRMVAMAHGVSRHIVRFVRYGDRVYAIKETEWGPATQEYAMLRELRAEHLPVVEPVGTVTGFSGAGEGRALLITRYLDFSLPYRYLLGRDEPALSDKLLDAAVVLLVRLHLEHVFWGDCSLSNILFRRDAGALMAYLVDAETTERSESISDGLRAHDLTIARENIAAGLFDLQADGRVPPEVEPADIVDELGRRYEQLWDELTRTEQIGHDERWRIERRVRHLNDLGFDVEELSIRSDGSGLAIKPILIEEGHHARELRRRTGLDVQENQARRLLADIASHRAWLEQSSGRPTPAAVAAARWLADVYEPVVEAIPPEFQERLEPAEVFHRILDHRYYRSRELEREMSHLDALDDYVASFLPAEPSERQLGVDEAAAGAGVDEIVE